MNLSEPSFQPIKKSFIFRFAIIFIIFLSIYVINDLTAPLYYSQYFEWFETFKHILVIVLLSFSIYHFLSKPLLKEISNYIAIENKLRKMEAANKSILKTIPGTILHVTNEGLLLDYKLESEGAMSLRIGNHIKEIFPSLVVQDILNKINATLDSGELQKLEIVLPNGLHELHKELRIIKTGDCEVIIILNNINDREQYEKKLTFISSHDTLTGLFNRTFFEAQLEQLAKGRHYPISIIVIDLDGLKETNNAFGHAVGDKMICKAADVLKKTFRADDLVARTGGDEFTILLTETDYHVLQLVVNRINFYLNDANATEPIFELRFSLGTAIADSNDKFYDAVRMADIRMHEDKTMRMAANM